MKGIRRDSAYLDRIVSLKKVYLPFRDMEIIS